MRSCSLRFAAALVVGAGILTSIMNSSALADGCMMTPVKLPGEAVDSFKQAPRQLLSRNPTGGPALSSEVRRLAASDIETVAPIIDLSKGATPEHIVGLAIGLAQAAAICAKNNPRLADEIKKLVTDSGIKALSAAYSAESSLVALGGPEECLPEAGQLGKGDPPDGQPVGASEEQALIPPSEEPQDIASELGIGQPGFLYPFTFGTEPTDTTINRLPPSLGGGGLVATTGDVVSPTR